MYIIAEKKETKNKYCVLSKEATNSNDIVIGLTKPGLELTIHLTRDEMSTLTITPQMRHTNVRRVNG